MSFGGSTLIILAIIPSPIGKREEGKRREEGRE